MLLWKDAINYSIAVQILWGQGFCSLCSLSFLHLPHFLPLLVHSGLGSSLWEYLASFLVGSISSLTSGALPHSLVSLTCSWGELRLVVPPLLTDLPACLPVCGYCTFSVPHSTVAIMTSSPNLNLILPNGGRKMDSSLCHMYSAHTQRHPYLCSQNLITALINRNGGLAEKGENTRAWRSLYCFSSWGQEEWYLDSWGRRGPFLCTSVIWLEWIGHFGTSNCILSFATELDLG